jgi:RNA polymerase sigma-70 factor (ECF subfamily)
MSDRSRVIALDPSNGFDEADVEELRRRVVGAVRRTCPRWLAVQAEDIVQSVVTRLLKTTLASEGKRTFSSIYLEKAAYGATVDEIRRLSRRREQPVSEPEILERVDAPNPGPEQKARASEVGRGIRDCLRRLAKPRRLAVTLYLEGCSVPETARRLDWTTKKAENLVYRGLADMRRCLGAKGLTP